MKGSDKQISRKTAFYRLFINNNIVVGLSIVLLVLLIMLVFTKVSHIFSPISEFFGIVSLPIIISGLFYYMLNPIVDFLEKKGISRTVGTFGLLITIIGLIIWGVIIVIPRIQIQTQSFINAWPEYWKSIETGIDDILSRPELSQFSEAIVTFITNLSSLFNNLARSISSSALGGISEIVGAVTNIVITIITIPIVLFYLLRDGKQLVPSFSKIIPSKMRKPLLVVLKDINKQFSAYVVGQVTVAFAVGIMFIIGFTIIGLEYSVTLGIFAGFLNLIPYIGSTVAMIPAGIIALSHGPAMIVAWIAVFIIEQTIEGRFIAPLVLGNQLAIHPLTILFVLLSAGKVFGFLGVLLGIPGYAAIKVIATHLFEWYRNYSGLYEEEV